MSGWKQTISLIPSPNLYLAGTGTMLDFQLTMINQLWVHSQSGLVGLVFFFTYLSMLLFHRYGINLGPSYLPCEAFCSGAVQPRREDFVRAKPGAIRTGPCHSSTEMPPYVLTPGYKGSHPTNIRRSHPFPPKCLVMFINDYKLSGYMLPEPLIQMYMFMK